MWLTHGALGAFDSGYFEDHRKHSEPIAPPIRPFGVDAGESNKRIYEDLAKKDFLHKTERLLHLGWVWFAGTVEVDGEPTEFCFPAISVPMRASMQGASLSVGKVKGMAVRGVGGFGLGIDRLPVQSDGDAEMTPLIKDRKLRDFLLDVANFGDGQFDTESADPVDMSAFPGLVEWIQETADAVGLKVDAIRQMHDGTPIERRSKPGIDAFVGCAMYLDPPTGVDSRKSSLLELANLTDLGLTAFAKIYGTIGIESGQKSDLTTLRPLSLRQRGIAERASGSDVAVISGAPGTGKSHVLSVIATDAVARGESVLVVAGSAHAVDVLVDHFQKSPGPTPVSFGGSRHGQRLATELSELLSRNSQSGNIATDPNLHDESVASVDRALRMEHEALKITADPTYRIDVVDRLDRAGDLHDLRSQLAIIGKPRRWPFNHSKRIAALVQRVGPLDDGMELVERLETSRDALRILAADGMSLDARLDAFAASEDAVKSQEGAAIIGAWIDQLGRGERRTLAKVAHAITLNRTARRRALAEIDSGELTKAAPLWVGSARDVDDVLPIVPELFDLVIIDEAAQLNQMNAANALIRATRAVICGDPNQLGQVSYLSTDRVEEVAEEFGSDASLVNPRTVSTYDAAASQVPAEFLDEHFRSVPHLIEFSARRFYGGDLHIATRHPMNESADHIDVSVVDGTRSKAKVNEAEVAECLRQIEKHVQAGYRSIGLISPFRAQADALENAIVATYRLEEIEAYGLRVGTVHGYQGDERDVIIASLCVGADESGDAWRFVNQKTLFNVMVTRAREQVVIVTSNPSPPGLAGEYVTWADPLTDIMNDVELTDPWTQRVAAALREQDLPVRVGYRVGRHVIDVVAGTRDAAVAIECGPHPDGVEAHLDRALQLRRSGWRTADAYQTMWGDRLGEFAISLANKFGELS